MFAYFESTLSWTDLAKRTLREMMDDDALGLAAQLAYYFFLALFPAVLCVIALASFLPLQNFTDDVIAAAGRVVPPEMLEVIREQMASLASGNDGHFAAVGLLGALWSSSAGLVAVVGAMNRAYDLEESRPWWKIRLIAVALTIGLSVLIVLSFGLIVAGPQVGEALAGRFGLGLVWVWTWQLLQWPIAFALVVTAISLIYYFAPDADQDWAWIAPGSLAAAVLWVLGSLAFRFYVVNFGSYQATYGAVAGVIVLLLWFYLSGLVLILGAEVSAEIEHASPWGKAPAQRIPGQRRKIGAAAGRAFQQRGSSTSPPRLRAPAATPVPPTVSARRSEPSVLARAGAAILLLIRWRKKVKP